MTEYINIPLNDFQLWMQQMLLDPYQQTEFEAKLLRTHSSNALTIEDVICNSDKLSAKEHLAIYQRSYILRLRNCMCEQFSALAYALGEDIFCGFADEYLASNPSTNYNLSLLGAHFPMYLEKNRPDIDQVDKERWIDFMIELAKFEYAIGVIFEQEADEDYQLANVEATDEEIRLVPVCEIFKFNFPIRQFYSDFKNENMPDLPSEKDSYCIVLRHNFRLYIYDVHKEQFEFLALLKQGMDIKTAKSTFIKDQKEDALVFESIWVSWKKRWIDAKFFRQCSK